MENEEVENKGPPKKDDAEKAIDVSDDDDDDDDAVPVVPTAATANAPDTYFPDPNLDNPSVIETLGWWAEFTSTHGVYYMLERGHTMIWKKVVWGILCAVTFGGLLWALTTEIQAFKEYKNNSNSRSMIPISMSFPQITVCNTNMYDSSLQNATGITEPSNEAELNAISQPFEDFILDTSFNGVTYIDQLTNIWEPVITPYGRCYKFQTDEQVYAPGPTLGLEMDLWLDQVNYEDSTLNAGVYVFAMQKGSTVTDQSILISVPPGDASYLTLGLFDFKREEQEPWKNCDGYAPNHTIELCRANCVNEATRRKCGCQPIGDSSNSTMQYCNSSDKECVNSVGAIDLAECALCLIPPCHEEVYVNSYSSAKIATKAAARLEEELALLRGDFLQNFVKIHINYDSIRYEQRTESRATDFSQLLSNLGGSMGFFMGLSMISVVEIVGELLCLRLIPRLWGNDRLYGIGQKQKYD